MKNINRLRYTRIIDDCFWDSTITEEDIDTILHSENVRGKKYLFEKILVNSTDLLGDLKLFKENELCLLMEGYQVPVFNHDYIFRRKNIAEVYFFDAPLLIDELKWAI